MEESKDSAVEILKVAKATMEKPQFQLGEICAYVSEEHDRIAEFLARDHDTIGRMLKCHLVLEHHLDGYLTKNLGLANLKKARLRFIQKLRLLPDDDPISDFFKSGLIQINTIRNKFSHDLDADIKDDDISDVDTLLDKVARPDEKSGSPIDRIQMFTTICCSCLSDKQPLIQEFVKEAIAKATEVHKSNQ